LGFWRQYVTVLRIYLVFVAVLLELGLQLVALELGVGVRPLLPQLPVLLLQHQDPALQTLAALSLLLHWCHQLSCQQVEFASALLQHLHLRWGDRTTLPAALHEPLTDRISNQVLVLHLGQVAQVLVPAPQDFLHLLPQLRALGFTRLHHARHERQPYQLALLLLQKVVLLRNFLWQRGGEQQF